MIVRAGEPLGVATLAVRVVVRQVDEVEDHHATGQAQCRLDRVGDALLAGRLGRQPVDNGLDRVLLLLLQPRRVGERVHDAVHPDPRVPLDLQVVEQVDVLAFSLPDHRGQDLEPGAFGHLENAIDDLLRGLLGDRFPTDGAMRPADAGEQQPEVVVDLGDRADRRARVAARRLLIDRHRRGQPLDEVHVRLVHLPEELPRVCGQRLHVATLALGEDRVESQARLAGAGQAGEDDQRVARQLDVNVLQVVLASTPNDQLVSHSLLSVRQAHGSDAREKRALLSLTIGTDIAIP